VNALTRVLAAFVLAGTATAALAHEGSTSYLFLRSTADGLEGRLDIALVDLALSLPLDADGDGRLTWNETLAGRGRIAGLVRDGLTLTRGGGRCTLHASEPWLADRLGLVYLSLDLAVRCASDGAPGVASTLFFDRDASHRLLVSLEAGGATRYATLSPAAREWSAPTASSGWRALLEFGWQGMWHVWIGYDHLLFLLLLMLPAVARRAGEADRRGRAVALDLARVVTAFTVAHSITLGLAATSVLRLPQPPIEAAIAASIVAAAVINLVPRLQRYRLPLAFGFGLVHGFGFANALAGLGQAGGATLPVLAGFNIGVELGNLVVIAAALPLLLAAGGRTWYEPRALRVASLAAAAVGAVWMLERI
jgi:hypothetical protein